MNARSRSALKTQRGLIIRIKSGVEIPLFAYKKRFCGLPKGVRREPRIAAIFSKVRTGRIKHSFWLCLNKIIVSGTKIMRDTSFVTNIELKKTPKTKKIVRNLIDDNFRAFLKTGSKISSLLKPSRTVRSIKRVASVLQFMSDKSSFEGGVIKSEIRAARRATESIMSFLKRFLSHVKIFSIFRF